VGRHRQMNYSQIIVYSAIFIGLLMIAIAWIIFPFLMLGKANEIIKLLRPIANNTDTILSDRLIIQHLESIADRLNETNKALQWLVDYESPR
jgi:hypothetical protein